MDPKVKRNPDRKQVRILDDQERVIGIITHPVEAELLGPGRETVYLQRRANAPRTPHAA